jgi:DNA-binding response OmpR family regulator
MSLRVLHIEDDQLTGKLVRRMLEASYSVDIQLTRAETLQKGIELLYQQRWDAVLLDLTLPDSLAEDTFDRVYAVSPQLPIVVLTSEPSLEIRAATIAMGAQDCIDKMEMSPDLLSRTLRFSVERQRTILELHDIIRELEASKKRLQELIEQVNRVSPPDEKH